MQKFVHQTFSEIASRLPLLLSEPQFPLVSASTMKMISLSVDGNISSGKSTLVSKLMKLLPKNGLISYNLGNERLEKVGLHVEVIPEPLEKWCNVGGHNLLEMFYKDPEKNNFIFEHYVQLTRLMDTIPHTRDVTSSDSRKHTGSPSNGPKTELHLRIMERSLQNNRHCFMELAKKSGKLHPVEFAVLDEWYKWWEAHVDINLDLLIYLQTKPETAFARMKSRARAAEDLCPYDYLLDLHEAYEEWLIRNPVTTTKKTHVIVLDANQTKDDVAAECFHKLNEYLQTLTPKKIGESTATSPASAEFCTQT